MTASHSSASMRTSRLSRVMPALLTRMSTEPSSSMAAFTIASHASRPSLVSPRIATARRPRPVISAGRGLGGLGVAPVVDGDVGALPRERQRDRTTEAPAPAGDQRRLAGEVEHQAGGSFQLTLRLAEPRLLAGRQEGAGRVGGPLDERGAGGVAGAEGDHQHACRPA